MATFTHNASNGTTAVVTTGTTKRAVMYISGGPLGVSMYVRPGLYKVNGVRALLVGIAKTSVTVSITDETRTMPIDEFVTAVVASELALRASYVP